MTGDTASVDIVRVGSSASLCVRRGGATRPQVRREISANGVSLRSDCAVYRCVECGHTKRLATPGWMEHLGWCPDCDDHSDFLLDVDASSPDWYEASVSRDAVSWCDGCEPESAGEILDNTPSTDAGRRADE